MSNNGSTFPADILPTTEKPDMVLHFPESSKVMLIELTFPFEKNITKAKEKNLER